MKNFVVIFSFLLLSSQPRAQYSFTQVSTGCTNDLYDVDFPTALVGYACGAGATILKTADGGYNWTAQPIADPDQEFYNIEFKDGDELNGWACGNQGRIYKTIDGGTNWTPVNPEVGNFDLIFKGISFFNASIGWIVGVDPMGLDEELIFLTSDGGDTWFEQNFSGMPGIYYDIQSLSTGLLFACGSDDRLIKSVDGGVNWTVPGTVTAGGYWYYGLHMINSTVGFAVGSDSQIQYTIDGGNIWTNLWAGFPGSDVKDIDFDVTSASGVIVGQMGYAISAGYTDWTTTYSLFPNLEGVELIDGSHGVLVGLGGTILVSPSDEDLTLSNYVGPTEVCGAGEVPVSVTIKNSGNLPMATAVVTVYDGSAPILSNTWNGYLLSGETENFLIGNYSFHSSLALTLKIDGDVAVDNNDLLTNITWYDDSTMGVDPVNPYCPGDAVQLNAYGGSCVWYDLIGSDATINNPLVYPVGNTSYTVGISNAYCLGNYEIFLTAKECGDGETTVISPNGDGLNDYLHLRIAEIDTITDIVIFDRWGEELFHRYKYNNNLAEERWDGKSKDGKTVLPGTYYYAIRTDNREMNGWFQIIR